MFLSPENFLTLIVNPFPFFRSDRGAPMQQTESVTGPMDIVPESDVQRNEVEPEEVQCPVTPLPADTERDVHHHRSIDIPGMQVIHSTHISIT